MRDRNHYGIALLICSILLVALVTSEIIRRRKTPRPRWTVAESTQAVRPATRTVEATDADVLQAFEDYRTSEGKQRRGRAFARLAERMTQRHVTGARYTEADVLRLLDTPDLCADSAPSQRTFAYFYDDSAVLDGSVLVVISEDGRATLFGWNNRAENDFSHPAWKPFDGPAQGNDQAN